MRWARSCVQKRHGWAAQVPRRLASESSRRKAGISPRSEQLCWHSAWARALPLAALGLLSRDAVLR